jgi:hypothetical protein
LEFLYSVHNLTVRKNCQGQLLLYDLRTTLRTRENHSYLSDSELPKTSHSVNDMGAAYFNKALLHGQSQLQGDSHLVEDQAPPTHPLIWIKQ